MELLSKYIQDQTTINSRTAFGFDAFGAKTPTIFYNRWSGSGANWKGVTEVKRFSENEKVGTITELKWFGTILFAKVQFAKPITVAGSFTNYITAGWIQITELKVLPPKTTATVGNQLYYSTGEGVNFRQSASTSGKSLGQFVKGQIIGESDGKRYNVMGNVGWLKFTNPDLGIGYVRQDYASTTKPAVNATKIVKPTATNTPSKTLPIQNPLDTPYTENDMSRLRKIGIYIIGGVTLAFAAWLAWNGKQRKKLIKTLTNGNQQ